MLYSDWREKDTGYYYYDDRGHLILNAGIQFNGYWYYLDGSGRRYESQFRQKGADWYYYDEEGHLVMDQDLKSINVITNYTEPRGVDNRTLDDFIRKINSILLRGVDISPNNFVRKINSILPPKYELLPCDFVQKINSILPLSSELLPCDFVQKTNFKYPHQKRQSRLLT